ncbi:AraC/XylS family transcriptional regulator [Neobacillus bataviensis LMG 21833]|uniref:AraC/XylS family transcriptional regulator n=1 Tax=Neobacillus bataviensis LMG 21833 TaxID=1117379 RepID=K6BXX8_9BACI|nr:DJ-1/PfpI family protein [Neobacillus bataviensis]EKN63780.1 AraC/XylS family transcriptional regulator [Neobacillus bataviensis LMG 21833]
MKKQWNVGIVLFDDVDVLDYSGPFEVLSLTVNEPQEVRELLTQGIPAKRRPFKVWTISKAGSVVTSNNGLKIVPDYSFENINQNLDILIVPGGPFKAIKACLQDRQLIHWIGSFSQAGGIIASVCSGAILLAEAGVLTGKTATTHPYAYDYLEQAYTDIEVVRNIRFVDNGNVLTSGGVSAGIDMSIYLVSKLLGDEAAATTVATLVYPYYDSELHLKSV